MDIAQIICLFLHCVFSSYFSARFAYKDLQILNVGIINRLIASKKNKL